MGVNYGAIGKRMKTYRKRRGQTQEELAEKLGVSVGYVSQMERGVTKISLDTLSEIAKHLECGLEELAAGVSPGTQGYLDRELEEITRKMNREQKQMLLEMAEMLLRYSIS